MASARSLLIVGLLCLTCWAKPVDFWKVESERTGETSVTTFSAKKDPAKGQGVLLWGRWPANDPPREEPLDPSVVLAGLYKDLKDFHLLGRKEVSWGDRKAQLVAFRAVADKRPVVARALISEAAEGLQVLLLVANPEAQKDFTKEFDRLQKEWEFSRPGAANVIYSPGEASPR